MEEPLFPRNHLEVRQLKLRPTMEDAFHGKSEQSDAKPRQQSQTPGQKSGQQGGGQKPGQQQQDPNHKPGQQGQQKG